MRPEPSSRATAIIVAAGRGTRLGAPDKILLPLAGRPLISFSIDAAEAAESISDIVIVAGLHTKSQIEQLQKESIWSKVRHIVLGGERRQDSVEAGLQRVDSDSTIVAVHDAARPFVTADLFDSCVAAARRTGAAIAAIPVVDTLKHVQADLIVETIPRDGIWAAQTPQAFQTELLRSAFAFAASEGIDVTDEAKLFELQGLPVEIVHGSAANLKVTRTEDLDLAEAIFERCKWARIMIRTGIGYDVHRFAEGRRLVLGGVEIPHSHGLLGHSDADVLLHAIADAILGAAALGDIGQHFPPTDPAFRDADSRDLLSEAARLVMQAGFTIGNVDATVIAEAPRILPFVDEMRTNIAGALGIAVSDVSVKATTNEGMGFVGRSEGIAALAIATLMSGS